MEKSCIKLLLSTIALTLLFAISSTLYATDTTQSQTSKQIVLNQSDLKFVPAPGLPAGIMIAHIRGDLSKHEPYTFRFQMPNCYVIPAHWHTNDEEVTVISGIFHVGFGDKIDKSQSTALTAGGFELVPGKAAHYVWSEGTTVVQLDGMGPRDTTFINPKELIPLFKANNQCPQ